MNDIKKEKGSVTLIAFFTILIFSLYGIIIYGRSASAYVRQTSSIETIQNVYSADIDIAKDIANSLGANYHIEE